MLTEVNWQLPLLGGVFIGFAVTIMLLFNGRVTGISGIINGVLALNKNDLSWRLAFLAGLVVAGAGLRVVNPEFFINTSSSGLGAVIVAGLLVGFGTLLGSGCTSGHGVCGISRFSIRSLLATITFILFGVLTVAGVRFFLGGQQ